ncbi:MAG TPA: attachment protein [Erythrobacter sp.]|nr:attachment protein [Erythrobacter sp.]
MKLSHQAHVALVDGENFTLYRNEGQVFDPKLVVENSPELEVTNFSAGVRHQDQIGRMLGRTQLDELAHGAAVTEWLNAKVIEGRIDELLIIADPKTLGEMRRHYHAQLRDKLVGEIDKTLTREPAGEIDKVIANS